MSRRKKFGNGYGHLRGCIGGIGLRVRVQHNKTVLSYRGGIAGLDESTLTMVNAMGITIPW